MKITTLAAVLAIAATAPAMAHAQIALLGMGRIDSSSAGAGADLSGLTETLEDKVAANRLDGAGSAIAYAGGDTFLALPDRGPNATPYDPAIDDTSSYISRFQTISLGLTPAAPGSALPLVVAPVLKATTLLSSATPLAYGDGAGLGVGPGGPPRNGPERFYFTGRSDNFAPGQSSSSPANARLDPEGLRLAKDGRSVFVSDEYGPFVMQFDRASGRRLKTFTLPAELAVAHLAPTEAAEIAQNQSGRTTNKGMEGLAITPDGRTLVGIMQAALRQDAASPASKKLLRIISIDIASGATEEYGYLLTDGSGVSEILAIDNHQFLVLERDGSGLGGTGPAAVKKLYRIDLAGAHRIDGLAGPDAAAAAVAKSEVADLVKLLGAAGVPAISVPSKIEGIAFGPDLKVNGSLRHTLVVSNDNDFRPDLAGPNQFYVFGFTDADIPGLATQPFGNAHPAR